MAMAFVVWCHNQVMSPSVPSRQFTETQHFGRFRGEVDIPRAVQQNQIYDEYAPQLEHRMHGGILGDIAFLLRTVLHSRPAAGQSDAAAAGGNPPNGSQFRGNTCAKHTLSLKAMQPESTNSQLLMLLERILDNAFPGESGASRLQQIGLFTLIYLLQDNEEPVTARRLSRLTGQPEGDVGSQLKKLIALDLVERTAILQQQGRGRAYKLTVDRKRVV